MSIAKKLKTVAENQQKVYDAGKQAEYDAFWDAYQENGNKTVYTYFFAGSGWTPENIRPKYDIKPTRADGMFASANNLMGSNFTEMLKKAGVILDTSLCTNFTNFTQYASPAYFPTIDTRSATSTNRLFCNSSVIQVDKIIFKEDGSQSVLDTFWTCNGLEEIDEIEGVIGQSMNLAPSKKVSKLTITNVINALSSTSSGMTLQLSKMAVDAAFTADAWNALVATKPNWTITLA